MKVWCLVLMLLERGEVKVFMLFDEKVNFYYDVNMLIGMLKFKCILVCLFVVI